jgi:hypothetical protein
MMTQSKTFINQIISKNLFMAITYVDIQDRYFMEQANDPINVRVEIGNAGIGGYLIFLDLQGISANQPASLGEAGDLVGKRCLVAATVPDTLDTTNWTSVTVWIDDGKHSHRYGPYSQEVAAHLDTVAYSISISFQTVAA